MTQPLAGLPCGTHFTHPRETTVYEVTAAGSEHELGWVEVRNLSMSDGDAERLRKAGAIDPRISLITSVGPVEVLP
jgi:hypothetical protein